MVPKRETKTSVNTIFKKHKIPELNKLYSVFPVMESIIPVEPEPPNPSNTTSAQGQMK